MASWVLTLPQIVEYLSAVAPHIDGSVLSKALIVESVHLGGRVKVAAVGNAPGNNVATHDMDSK